MSSRWRSRSTLLAGLMPSVTSASRRNFPFSKVCALCALPCVDAVLFDNMVFRNTLNIFLFISDLSKTTAFSRGDGPYRDKIKQGQHMAHTQWQKQYLLHQLYVWDQIRQPANILLTTISVWIWMQNNRGTIFIQDCDAKACSKLPQWSIYRRNS